MFFSPSPNSQNLLEKKPLSSKDVLKLHIEGKIYDPFIKNKITNIKSTADTSYIRRKSKNSAIPKLS